MANREPCRPPEFVLKCAASSAWYEVIVRMLSPQAMEQALCARSDPALAPASEGWVLPWYEGRSLVNVPATLAHFLGASLPAWAAPPLEAPYLEGLPRDRTHILLVLLDALGYRQFLRLLAERPRCIWGRLAERGVFLPMTSVCPSTTATALACLATGAEPIVHGLLGYELWLREYGVLTQMLQLRPVYGTDDECITAWGFVPEAFLPVPSLGQTLGPQGIMTTLFTPAAYIQSALSRILYRGFGRVVGYSDVADLWLRAAQYFAQPPAERSLNLVYFSGIDTAIHLHGSEGGVWEAQFDLVTRAFEAHFYNRLTPAQRQRILLILVADHGFVDTPVEAALDADADPVLRQEMLIPYSGESRLAYLHLLRGADPTAWERLRAALGERFALVEAGQAVARGLFGWGTPGAESLARLGQAIALARGNHYLDRQEKRFKLRGRHGGLLPEEMLIPWLAAPLDL